MVGFHDVGYASLFRLSIKADTAVQPRTLILVPDVHAPSAISGTSERDPCGGTFVKESRVCGRGQGACMLGLASGDEDREIWTTNDN